MSDSKMEDLLVIERLGSELAAERVKSAAVMEMLGDEQKSSFRAKAEVERLREWLEDWSTRVRKEMGVHECASIDTILERIRELKAAEDRVPKEVQELHLERLANMEAWKDARGDRIQELQDQLEAAEQAPHGIANGGWSREAVAVVCDSLGIATSPWGVAVEEIEELMNEQDRWARHALIEQAARGLFGDSSNSILTSTNGEPEYRQWFFRDTQVAKLLGLLGLEEAASLPDEAECTYTTKATPEQQAMADSSKATWGVFEEADRLVAELDGIPIDKHPSPIDGVASGTSIYPYPVSEGSWAGADLATRLESCRAQQDRQVEGSVSAEEYTLQGQLQTARREERERCAAYLESIDGLPRDNGTRRVVAMKIRNFTDPEPEACGEGE